MAIPIHHVTFSVSDVEKTASWYRSLFGVASEIQRKGLGWKRIRLTWPSGLALGFTEHENSLKDVTFSHLVIGLDHIGLTCTSEAEVHSWARKLDELGYEHGPVEDVAYAWAVTARDPDNIPIEFFCPK
jgi:catechol 2,3-dioxygenase-like lactoylglutathione lyase family enzyme